MKKKLICCIFSAIAAVFLAAYCPKEFGENEMVLSNVIHSSHMKNMDVDDGALFFGLSSGKEGVKYGFRSLEFNSNSMVDENLETRWIFIWNPVSGCSVSGCAASACGGSGCFGSACAASGCGGSGCAGSGCGGSACGGSACGGSACGGSACGGSACGGSVCGGSACGGSACGGSACGASGCVGSLCAISGCAGSACAASGCAVSICAGSGCGASACIASTCGGSVCVGSSCAGSVCAGSGCSSKECGEGGDFMLMVNSFNYHLKEDQVVIEISTNSNVKLINGTENYLLKAGIVNQVNIKGKYSKVLYKEIDGKKVIFLLDFKNVEHQLSFATVV
ncbi:hypothetical protein [Akkermansia sp.]|uniref:hypothetical protein n=1 Tax=Akkermansia sp. TaxID=1872421 RepID=UPI0025C52F61|nr:hypothetical protein [Akkermansia sp.]MCC8147834.1 hypothetical protein [Akkermansia sp.]